MSDEAKPASEEPKQKRWRSPAYPAIDLETAMKRASVLWTKINRHACPIESAAPYWGYEKGSSKAASEISAMIKYGLLSDDGAGSDRTIKLTERGVKLGYNPDTNSPEFVAEVKSAALSPSINRELWQRYEGVLPDDAIINRYLVVDRKFNEQYVDDFIAQFRSTIAFSKLQIGDIVDVNDETNSVVVRPAGQPKRLTDPLGQFVYPKPADQIPGTTAPHLAVTQPVATKGVLAEYSVPLGPNQARIVFTGENLSPDDFDALIEYVTLFKRQFERRMARHVGLEKVSGTVATQPQMDGTRVKFLLALSDGQVLSCMSGAGTSFSSSNFVNGQPATLIGERKADLTLGTGRTPFFVFTDIGD